MAFGYYDDKNLNALFVATPDDPYQVAVFGDCAAEKSALGQRKLLATYMQTGLAAGALHAYGVALDPGNALYLSFQDTGAVRRLDVKNNYTPFSVLPPELVNSKRKRNASSIPLFWIILLIIHPIRR
jgi:hypothetical protein